MTRFTVNISANEGGDPLVICRDRSEDIVPPKGTRVCIGKSYAFIRSVHLVPHETVLVRVLCEAEGSINAAEAKAIYDDAIVYGWVGLPNYRAIGEQRVPLEPIDCEADE